MLRHVSLPVSNVAREKIMYVKCIMYNVSIDKRPFSRFNLDFKQRIKKMKILKCQ